MIDVDIEQRLGTFDLAVSFKAEARPVWLTRSRG
jgi:hypothetical protein